MAMKIRENEEAFFTSGKVAIPYKYSAGEVGSRFLIGLRDNKKLTGLKCPACNKVYVPPRATCKGCFAQLDQWVDVSDKGTLVTFTVTNQPNPAQPVKPPIAYGVVKLDGADTGFVHMLGEVAPDKIKIGMRLQAVFQEDRKASILDIKYFKPV